MQNDLVSIITPCYNGSKYIGETIESVLLQTYKNFEMIIIDDGSKDNSVKVIQEYANKDDRIKLIKQSNGGSASARNNGIRNANGRYITLLDADDLWDDNFLEEQIKFLNENDATLVFCNYRHIDDNSKEIMKPTNLPQKVTLKQMQIRCYIGCLTGLYDSLKFGKIYLREELKSLRDDYAYWLDIMNNCKIAYGNQKILASYRVMSGSITGKKYKLIRVQYNFYRDYLKFGIAKSLYNTFAWGIAGFIKFYIKK